MERHFNINFRMLQGILIMLLVFFFNPLKTKLQELTKRIFASETSYYRKILRDIPLTIQHATYMDLEDLLNHIALQHSARY